MGQTGRRVLLAVGVVAALVAVVAALPGGSGDSATPRGVVFEAPARSTGPSLAVTSDPTSPRPVTIPPLTTSSAATASTVVASSTATSAAPAATPSSRPATSTSHRSTATPPPAARTSTTSPTIKAPASKTTQKTTSTRAPAPPRTTTAPKTTAPKTTPAKTTTPKTTTKRPAPKAPDFGIPVSVGDAQQIVTVTASSSSATTGTLRAWQKQSNGSWTVVHGPYQAWLGRAGIGQQSEGSTRTPIGTFTLTEAFGRDPDPGTALPYHQTQPNDWWVSDVHSSKYNTLQTCSKCSFDTSVSEHLYYEVPYYDYAVVMDVNRWPAEPGAGSAFFLHVSPYHEPTAGCVAIDEDHLLTIMRWLDPDKHPRIATGIG